MKLNVPNATTRIIAEYEHASHDITLRQLAVDD